MRRSVILLVLLAVIAGAGYAGWQWWTIGRFFQSTDNAYLHSDISVVSPKIEGYVQDVAVTDNQRVRAGDVLVRIDRRDFTDRLTEAQATVDVQRAAIGSEDSRIALQQSLIEQAQAAITSVEADQIRARQDFDRMKSLLREDFVSRQRFEQATADTRKADAAVVKARAALATEQGQLVVLRAARRETEAKLRQAEAAFAVAQTNLDHTVIRAAVDGVVGNRGVQLGQYVRAGTQLLSIVPLETIYVVANFKETQLARIHQGQKVTIAVDAYPGRRVEGLVASFAPASGSQFSLLPPQNATGNFTKVVQRVPIRIEVPPDNPLAGRLRPGLSVVVSVDTRDLDPQLSARDPADALTLPPQSASR
jgi:membrane fusion protein (multidrug efflux system)